MTIESRNGIRNLTNTTGLANSKPALSPLRFKADFKGDSLEIGNGDYSRRFLREDEPFMVNDKDEEGLLLRSGYFEKASAPAEVHLIQTEDETETSSEQGDRDSSSTESQ